MEPIKSHFADTLIKTDPLIAKILSETLLGHGNHTHPATSYVVMTDCPETLQLANSTRTDIEERLIEAQYQSRKDSASPPDNRHVAHYSKS